MSDEAEHDPWLDLPWNDDELRAIRAAHDRMMSLLADEPRTNGYRRQRRKRGYRAWPGRESNERGR